ncbi:MAG: RsmB/NOP family class I SAM-dependent RNA methyltransferase [Hyphomicrobiales bacterium]|nr:RsmB/NOP family class I SAM-dependent RNA methyltransferase [Hyphomicrobiales bacterium]
MKLAGRALAACEILADMDARHRPAPQALADWGREHRFAGSGDRAAIGNLVYDALRRRASLAWIMLDDAPPALVAAALKHVWGMEAEAVAALFDGSAHAPAPLSDAQRARLNAGSLEGAPDWVLGDYPEWLQPSMTAAFGDAAAAEGAELAQRAPIDLRVNALKATRAKVLAALVKFGAEATPHSPLGVRAPPRAGAGRSPHVEAEPAHGKGWFEVQDEGSQIAALLTGAGPRMQVADVCAGAGGKTLALAAMMQNTGQIHAFDADPQRMRPLFDRLRRAGARNVQAVPAGDEAALAKLNGTMDVVLVDAPCSGSGTWRRRPDAKWRLTPEALAARQAEQRAVLALGAPLVRPGGRLVYVTCSVLPEENADQAAWFLSEHPQFAAAPWEAAWKAALPSEPPASAASAPWLQLTPARHGTDGFFIALFEQRKPG